MLGSGPINDRNEIKITDKPPKNVLIDNATEKFIRELERQNALEALKRE